MNFDELNKSLPENCDCLEKSIEDLTHTYARHFNKPTVRSQDMLTKWEKYTNTNAFPKNLDLNDCVELCGLKGLSVDIWNEESKEAVIQRYLKTFKIISPKNKNAILIFKLKLSAGKFRHTPREHDKFHYDFYKADGFTIDLVEVIEFINLSDYL